MNAPPKENVLETRESLLLRRTLLKPTKEVNEQAQTRALFRRVCKAKGKCCQVIIDSGNTYNLVSTEMVDKLCLEKVQHPNPYKVSWLHKGHQILVNEQSEVEFQIGNFRDKVLCDIMPMDVCHIFVGKTMEI